MVRAVPTPVDDAMTHAPLLFALLLIPGEKTRFDVQVEKIQKLLSDGLPGQLEQAEVLLKNLEREAREYTYQDKPVRLITLELWARLRRAECETRLGDPAKARETLTAALRDAPEDHLYRFELYRDLGKHFSASGETSQAEA